MGVVSKTVISRVWCSKLCLVGCGTSTVEFIGKYLSGSLHSGPTPKECSLARGFKPGFHGATTLPMYSHLTRGGYACPLALSRVLAGLVLRAQLVRCFQSLSGRCTFSVLVYSTVIR